MLEHRSLTDNERFRQLESQLKEARNAAEDADRKYDEVRTLIIFSLFITLTVKSLIELVGCTKVGPGRGWSRASGGTSPDWWNVRRSRVALKRKLWIWSFLSRKILELEEELKVVGNNVKSLEVSEEKVRWLPLNSALFQWSLQARNSRT